MTRHRGCLKEQPAADDAAGEDAPDTAGLPQPEMPGQTEAAQVTPDGSLDACGRERQLVTRTRERYGEIRRAARRRAVAGRDLPRHWPGPQDRAAVRPRRQRSMSCWRGAMNRESKLDRFKPYLCQRWNQGLTDASAAARRAAAARLGRQRADRPPLRGHLLRQALAAPVTPAPAVPKTREITRWLLTRPDQPAPTASRPSSAAVTERCPHLQALAGHVRDFAEMMTRGRACSQDLEALAHRQYEADDGQPDLHSLATGIRTRPGGRHRRARPPLPLRRQVREPSTRSR